MAKAAFTAALEPVNSMVACPFSEPVVKVRPVTSPSVSVPRVTARLTVNVAFCCSTESKSAMLMLVIALVTSSVTA